jgi:hypothetical protein
MSQIAGYNKNVILLNSSTSADWTLAAFRAPFGGATITGAWAVSSTVLAASTSDYFNLVLLNGGTVGTATAAIGTVGGTTGWAAQTAQAFTLNAAADELTEGQYLMAKYDETGTVAVADVQVIVEWVHGKG